jgi:hypothetical protein
MIGALRLPCAGSLRPVVMARTRNSWQSLINQSAPRAVPGLALTKTEIVLLDRLVPDKAQVRSSVDALLVPDQGRTPRRLPGTQQGSATRKHGHVARPLAAYRYRPGRHACTRRTDLWVIGRLTEDYGLALGGVGDPARLARPRRETPPYSTYRPASAAVIHLGVRDLAAVVGPGHRTHHTLPTRALLGRGPARRATQPPSTAVGHGNGLVSRILPDLPRHPRRLAAVRRTRTRSSCGVR